jgi:hypothetical protein
MRRLSKISKACEPCRRRKVKCNGQQPCDLCQQHPANCVFRAKARDRTSTRQRAARNNYDSDAAIPMKSQTVLSETSPTVPAPKDNQRPADPEVYRGITATHAHDHDSGEHAQLFYGPSSNFAFLQQFHKSIVNYGLRRQPEGQENYEGSNGLDMFVQRSIFFGTPASLGTTRSTRSCLPIEMVTVAQASIFLTEFKAVSLHLLPLFTETELDQMLHSLYSHGSQTALRPQEMALILAVLADGALSTNATDMAELLFEQAKTTASAFDESVTLSMIQFYMLLADYQINMGRPNSAYLYLGAATRRAIAMGLNREVSRATSDERNLQKRRSTMWTLFFHERYMIPRNICSHDTDFI